MPCTGIGESLPKSLALPGSLPRGHWVLSKSNFFETESLTLLFLSALCFLVILLAQISEKRVDSGKNLRFVDGNEDNFFIDILDMDLFPGPHSEKKLNKDDEDHAIFHDNQDKNENESVTLALNEAKLPEEDNANFNETAHNGSALAVECLFRYKRNSPSDQLIGRIFRLVKVGCTILIYFVT